MRIGAGLRRRGDVVLAVVLAVAYAVELSRYARADHLLAVPLGAAAALALIMRRRAPLAMFVAVLVLTQLLLHWAPGFQHDSISSIAVVMVGLYSLGRYARGAEAWIGAVLVLVEIALAVIGDGDETPVGVFFFLLFCGLPWAAGVAVRLRIDRVGELEVINADLQEKARRAVADERTRIARELHDVVSHAIAVTVLQARGSAKLVGRDDDAVRLSLAAIEQTNTSALADMRRLLVLLRRADDQTGWEEPQPTLDHLGALVHQVCASGLPVELEILGEPLPIPPGLDLSAYRIVQEALTNVLKHAGEDATAHVRLRYGPGDLEVEVTNTGRRTEAAPVMGHGLIGIRERVVVAGGSLAAGPSANGYAIVARLPYLLDPV